MSLKLSVTIADEGRMRRSITLSILVLGMAVAVSAAFVLAGRHAAATYTALVGQSMQVIWPDGASFPADPPVTTLAAFDLSVRDATSANTYAQEFARAGELLKQQTPNERFAEHQRALVTEFELGSSYYAALGAAIADAGACGSESWKKAQVAHDAYIKHALRTGAHFASVTGSVWSLPTFEKPRAICR